MSKEPAKLLQCLCRQRKKHRSWFGLCQDRNRSLVTGVHDVARINHAHAHAAIVGRLDVGVVEIGLRGFDRGHVSVDRGFVLVDLGLLQIEVLLGLGVF